MVSTQAVMPQYQDTTSIGQHHIKDRMICTDLDGTLVGDDESMYELLDLIGRNRSLLVFDTGRDLASVQRLIERKDIQRPDAMICMVGTEIYFLDRGEFCLDQHWRELISKGWNRQGIVEQMKDIPELSWQDSRWQTDFKISYLLRENQQAVLKEIDHRLKKAQLEAKVVYSCGKFLDFLPYRASKNGALHYINTKLGINKEDVVVCGDSGNDLDLFKAGYKGIVVGNAHRELRDCKCSNAYHATSQYAAGITEGLRYFGYFEEIDSPVHTNTIKSIDFRFQSVNINVGSQALTGMSKGKGALSKQSKSKAVEKYTGVALCRLSLV